MLESIEYASEKLFFAKIEIELVSKKPFTDKELLNLKTMIENGSFGVNKFQKATQQYAHGITIKYKEDNLSVKDKQWVTDLIRIVDEHLETGVYDLTILLKEINMRRTLFYSKIKALLKTTPNNLFLAIKFAKANYLLKTGTAKSVLETSKAVGFKDVNYFNREFKKRFGVLPSELMVG